MSKNSTKNITKNSTKNITKNSTKNITNKNTLLMKSLDIFYNNDYTVHKFIDIVKNKEISLRVIDWFVTNYSKKYNVVIDGKYIIYIEYKSQLKAYTKKYFDPFCRRERLNCCYRNIEIDTTVGQLNFFKWMIQNKILDYIYENLDKIDKDMNIVSKNKNYELYKNAPKKTNIHNIQIILNFN